MYRYLFVFIILFFSCNFNHQKQERQIKKYFQQVFNINYLNGKYYIFKVDSCSSCNTKELAFEFFLNNDFTENTTLLIIGSIENRYKNKIDILENLNYNIINDTTSKLYAYETGFSKSMLVHFKDNKLIMKTEIYDSLFDGYLENYMSLDK